MFFFLGLPVVVTLRSLSGARDYADASDVEIVAIGFAFLLVSNALKQFVWRSAFKLDLR